MPSELLKVLMRRAHDGEVVLPEFQRDFVWKTSDVSKLLTSLFNGYPIGGLLFMENTAGYASRLLDGAPEPSRPTTEDAQASNNIILVLDGQQRLTSCYRAFYGVNTGSDDDVKYRGRYYFDYGKFSMLSETERGELQGSTVEPYVVFVPAQKVEKELADSSAEMNRGLFPLDIIFTAQRGTDYSTWLSTYTYHKAGSDTLKFQQLTKVQAQFTRMFLEQITSYQVHFEEIKKGTSPDVICTVFETINTTGKRLTVFDLLVARCYPKGLRLREDLEAALERPMIKQIDPDGEEVCVTILPRILSLLAKKQCRRADVLEMTPAQIRENWGKGVNALEKALTALAMKFGAFGSRFIPLLDIVPSLAIILSTEKFSRGDRKRNEAKLRKWYWRCVFSSYFVSSGDTKTARSVREWTEDGGWLDDDTREPEAVREFHYSASILDGVAREESAVYQGVVTILLSNGLTDFGSARKRISAETPELWDDIQDHHLYPKGLLTPCGVKGVLANQILNRTPILKQTNIAIKNDAPHFYYSKPSIVGPHPLDDKLLGEHAIPPKGFRMPFAEEVYAQFLQERKQLLLKLIADAVAKEPSPPEGLIEKREAGGALRDRATSERAGKAPKKVAKETPSSSGPRVTLPGLIAAALLAPPVRLFRRYKGHDIEATLLADGRVVFKGEHYDTCSAAAEHARGSVTGRRMNTNGWVFWQYRGEDGQAHLLDEVRQRLLKMKTKPQPEEGA